MCFVRLVSAGVGTVIHVATDALGGMVTQKKVLPAVWRQLAASRSYREARCAQELKELAVQIFALNRTRLNKKLGDRSN